MGTPTLIKTRQIESGTFGGGIGALIIKDEGVFLATGTVLDFVGDGVTPTASGTNIRVYIPAGSGTGGGGGLGVVVQDEGAFLVSGTIVNFVGDGVTVTASGTQARVYIPSASGSLGSASFIYNEVPSGTVNGSNAAFYLYHALVTGTLQTYMNGLLQSIGAGNDYILSGTILYFNTAPPTGSTLLCSYQESASAAGNADTLDGYHAASFPLKSEVSLASDLGWIPITGTCTFLSADAPSYVMSFNGDMTGILNAGMRFKCLASGTANQFIITAVGSYSGGMTPVTLYGGTDYTLPSGTMASPYYSREKAPFGFPLNPAKWTVTATDSTNAQQASAVTGTWYNLGSINISIPIGVWHVSYQVALRNSIAAGNQVDCKVTLSTGNNTQSDAAFTAMMNIANDHATALFTQITSITRFKYLLLASKTTYYLNAVTSIANSTLNFRGDILTTTIACICAYL